VLRPRRRSAACTLTKMSIAPSCSSPETVIDVLAWALRSSRPATARRLKPLHAAALIAGPLTSRGGADRSSTVWICSRRFLTLSRTPSLAEARSRHRPGRDPALPLPSVVHVMTVTATVRRRGSASTPPEAAPHLASR
jgi:hypothetical protein